MSFEDLTLKDSSDIAAAAYDRDERTLRITFKPAGYVQNLSHFQDGRFLHKLKEQQMSDEKTVGQVIQTDEARIRDHLGEMVRGTVELKDRSENIKPPRCCGAFRK
jgi:hypothetical protein